MPVHDLLSIFVEVSSNIMVSARESEKTLAQLAPPAPTEAMPDGAGGSDAIKAFWM